jgi:hypothetical protein
MQAHLRDDNNANDATNNDVNDDNINDDTANDDNNDHNNDDYTSSEDNYYSADHELDNDYHDDRENKLVDDNSVSVYKHMTGPWPALHQC